ncbi:MAG: U4/U6-U5 snRNP complex subunit prp31 [Vezdaea aestivalis]|nr:MAG: U4/U6-U5 snRNP complex subunit prp31 [Vezdaea aestivalis]
MASIADELLQDFEDSGSEGEANQSQTFPGYDDAAPQRPPTDGGGAPKEIDMELDGDEEAVEEADQDMLNGNGGLNDIDDEEEAKAKVEKMDLGGVDDVRSVAGLMKTLDPVLEKIRHYQTLPSAVQSSLIGNIEDNPEYHLLTQSNNLSTSIDNEIILVHKFIRDHYSVRFPELENLVTNPLDYAKSVAIIRNGPMSDMRSISQGSNNPVGAPLRSVLDGPTLMVVTVEATTTKGRDLSEAQLARILSACELTLSLDRAKTILTDYVQSRMTLFAPNLTSLIGSLTAAQLLNHAGGLTGLAKTPSCNLAPLGSKKQSQTGLATNVGLRHEGFLYNSPIVRSIPSDLKRQALRILSAKVVLAARVDHVHSDPSGSTGEDLKAATIQRLEKLTEPPPNKGPRALPAPDDKPARKRGGRQARKQKEATAMTDLRKAQNRMAFGNEEQEVGFGDETKGLGMIGQGQDGRIRAQQVDGRTRAKLGKHSKGWGMPASGGAATSIRGFGTAGTGSVIGASGLRTAGIGTGTNIAGTASTIAFTPVQGLELVDPRRREEVERKRKGEEDRWFAGGTFTQIGDGGGKMQDGFKVPALPIKKRRIE